jgi:hypothetical protein
MDRRSVLSAGVAMSALSITSMPARAQGAPARLTGIDAINALIGNTIVGRTGHGLFAVFFAPGGKLRSFENNVATPAAWEIRGNQLCFIGPREGPPRCSGGIEVEGDRVFGIIEDEAKQDSHKAWKIPGNAFVL